MRASIMSERQRKQRGPLMGVAPAKYSSDMDAPPLIWIRPDRPALSVAGSDSGDGRNIAQSQASHWSKMLTFGKILIGIEHHPNSNFDIYILCGCAGASGSPHDMGLVVHLKREGTQ
jgi:hypothetical protein